MKKFEWPEVNVAIIFSEEILGLSWGLVDCEGETVDCKTDCSSDI